MGTDGNKGAAATSLFGGMGWFVFWLFTVGFAGLPFWKAVWAIFVWPYYLGVALR